MITTIEKTNQEKYPKACIHVINVSLAVNLDIFQAPSKKPFSQSKYAI